MNSFSQHTYTPPTYSVCQTGLGCIIYAPSPVLVGRDVEAVLPDMATGYDNYYLNSACKLIFIWHNVSYKGTAILTDYLYPLQQSGIECTFVLWRPGSPNRIEFYARLNKVTVDGNEETITLELI